MGDVEYARWTAELSVLGPPTRLYALIDEYRRDFRGIGGSVTAGQPDERGFCTIHFKAPASERERAVDMVLRRIQPDEPDGPHNEFGTTSGIEILDGNRTGGVWHGTGEDFTVETP